MSFVAAHLSAGVLHVWRSTPGVFRPRFSVTRFTANAFALVDLVRSRCSERTLRHSPAFAAFAMRACNLATTLCTDCHGIPCHEYQVAEATSQSGRIASISTSG